MSKAAAPGRGVRAAAALCAAALAVLPWAAPAGAAPAPAPREGADTPEAHTVPEGADADTTTVDIRLRVDSEGLVHAEETLVFGSGAGEAFTRGLGAREEYDADRDRVYPVEGVRAEDGSGAELPVRTEEDGDTLDLVVERGDAEKAVLTYTVRGALEDTGDGVELEWTPVAGYSAPVAETNVRVDAPLPPLALSCTAGGERSSIYCTSSDMGGHEALTARFLQANMVPGQRLSIAVAYPPGTAPAAPVFDRTWSLTSAFAVTPVTGSVFGVLLVGLLGGLAALIRIRGQDERALRTESGAADNVPLAPVPGLPGGIRFRPPDGVHPGQIGTLIDEQADVVDIAATVVDLAVRGHYTIEELPHEHPASVDWVLSKRVPPADEELLPYERMLMDALFERRVKVRLSHLRRGGFGPRLGAVRDELYRDMVRLKWFARRPNVTRNRWATAGIGLTAAGVALTVVLAALTHAAFTGLAVVIAGAAMTLGAQYMPAKTAKGSSVLAHAMGFRAFLMSAEAEHVPEGHRVELFSRYLPYALIFDNVDRWASVLAAAGEREESANKRLPWYEGPEEWHVGDFAESIRAFVVTLSGVVSSARHFRALG
ncbi:DUF2207 domain-containing protein [Nocardiopsis suaedae]|uniref:DUF2207 domain-containing protein n=1 Tax=Nocardiopsis suaedae TaxID=3018444 RepID=A0ABT4TQR7_9ACTN|nr:DUF2207 domain-containing protein [Nocardiopsis suaedae]MDA2807032.1 DUF2207 domain-containing protein [Nocardiopsis suaedae]